MVGESDDGGFHFGHFFQVEDSGDDGDHPGVDKPQLATGPAGPGTTTQAVYVAYTQLHHILGVRSRDIHVSGMRIMVDSSFTTPQVVDDDFEFDPRFPQPAVGPEGELYVSWCEGNITKKTDLRLDHDLDGLWSGRYGFGGDIVIRDINRDLNGEKNAKVPAQPSRGIFNGPVLAVDRSGPLPGRLYLTFVDGFGEPTPAEDTDIYLISSDDQGSTWTSFDPGTPGNVEDSPGTDFLPWVTVDQVTGGVYVAYYTTDGAADNTQVNVRLACSIDGGKTFTKTNVSSSPSQAASTVGRDDFLEYIGLAARDGTAHVLWADNRRDSSGKFGKDLLAYTASVSTQGDNELQINGDDLGPRGDIISLHRSIPNPDYFEVVVNGQIQFSGLFSSLRNISVYGEDGSDIFYITATVPGVPVFVNGGRGNDNVFINSPAQGAVEDLTNIAAPIYVFGGDGNDTVTLWDSSRPRRRLYRH